MSHWLKWVYSIGFFLAMCGLLAAGTYQYRDNLSVPYNINLFTCSGIASCTAMVLQDSSGNEIFTQLRPGVVSTSGSSVTLSGSPVSVGVANGADAAQGSTTDNPLASPFSAGTMISVLKGIMANVLTPISVTGTINTTPAGSPQNVTVANQPTVALSGSPVSVGIASGSSPVNVTLSSPVSVAISTASSPINVTGNFTSASPQTVNIGQVQSVNIASPSTYGTAPVGSVPGVNAFVTSLPASPVGVALAGPTPLAVTLPASPLSVGIAGPTPLNVTVGGIVSPLNTTLATSPVSVAISTVSSPINVTGNFSTASPQGVAVVNNVNVTPPTPLQVTLPASPVSVAIAGPTPLAVTLPSSPVSVAISTVSSPLNVTGSFSTTVSSPLGVIPFNGASPQNVTLAASPVSVAISTVSSPLNVTGNISTTISSPAAMNLVQVQNQNVASPSTYGTAPVGSVVGVNAFVTSLPGTPLNVTIGGPTPLNVTVGNLASPQGVAVVNNVTVTTPTPLQVTLPASPISVGIAGPTPLNVTMSSTPLNVTVGNAQTNGVNVDVVQWAGQNVASPQTYGTTPVGSAIAANAFITNANLNGQATMANSTPVVIASDQSEVMVSQSLASPSFIQAFVPTSAYFLTNTAIAIGPTPGIIGPRQLAMISCAPTTPIGTPASIFLEIWDVTPHASGSDLGAPLTATNLTGIAPVLTLAIAGTPVQVGQINHAAPGLQFNKGISIAVTQGGAKSATPVGTNVNCAFSYN